MMEKKVLVILLLIIILCSPVLSSAETIILKSGKKVEGKVIEKTDKYVKIDFLGVPITYFMDEIERIYAEKSGFDEVALSKGRIVNVDLGKNVSNPDEEENQVFQFYKKNLAILNNSQSEIGEKGRLATQAAMAGNQQEARRLAGELKDLAAQLKHNYETSMQITPPACEELKSLTLRFLQIQEELYDATSKGNNEQTQSLALELIKYYNKIQEKSNRIVQHYGKKSYLSN